MFFTAGQHNPENLNSAMSENDRMRRVMIFGCVLAALLAIYVGTTFHDAIADTLIPLAL